MIKIIGIIISALIVTTLIKRTQPVFSLFVTIACALLIFLMIADDFARITRIYSEVLSAVDSDNNFFSILLKILGISLVSQFVINICNDSGESALAAQTELAAKVIIVITVLPVFETIIRIATGLLK